MSAIWMPRWIRHAGRLMLSARARQDALWERRRRRNGAPVMPTGSISNVLVVCHGNLCRSPFAAGLLAARRSDLSVRSAGLAAGDSDPADRAALRVSRQFGVELDAHRTRLLNLEDLGWSDLILCMEGHQAVRIGRTGREYLLKTRLLGDFLPIPPHLIKDPWGCSDEVYVETFERISNALERLSKVVEKQ